MEEVVIRSFTPVMASMILVIFLNYNSKLEERIKFLFYLLIAISFTELIFSELEMWTSMWAKPTNWRILCSVICYTLQPFMIYVVILISAGEKLKRKFKMLCLLPTIVNGIIASTAFFQPIAFYFDESNHFGHGIFPFGYSTQITIAIYSILLIGLYVRYHGTENSKDIIVTICLVLYIIGVTVVETLSHFGYSGFVRSASVMGIVIFYLYYQTKNLKEDLSNEIEEKKRIKEESRAAIMTFQIRPHFLYNSLGTIQGLILKDPEEAYYAIGDFADYLRDNLDSLRRMEPIWFEKELSHTKKYISLEEMRHPNLFTVEFNLSITEFKLPAITIQPLVENAIKHGLKSKEKGGIIKISTMEDMEYVYIKVQDNGCGFTVGEKKNDGRSHIALENVRNRLKTFVNGEMEIYSKIGEGTTIIIKIPKTLG